MSYIPTIIVHQGDLIKNRDIIEAHFNSLEPKRITPKWQLTRRAFIILRDKLEDDGFQIRDVSMVMISNADLTKLNQAVRDVLTELNIEFATYN